MLKAIVRLGITLLFLFALVPHQAGAQVAPTNTAAISGSVSDSTGKPVAGAQVSLNGPKNASTKTDTHGLFVFIGVPFGTYQISAASPGLGTVTRELSVDGDTNVAIQYEPTNLKVIANVSSSATARFNVTAASVTQVNPIQAAFNGETSWRKILGQIPGVSFSSATSGFLTLTAFPDSPLTPAKISINGTLPYETATLLDNMPLISGSYNSILGSGTDLSLYGMDSFSSADVVRGPGANAPTIVDSIGGSLLLQAPGPVAKSHFDLSMSTDPYGGIVATALAAVRIKKLSATVTYGVNNSPGPLNVTGLAGMLYQTPLTVNGQTFSCTAPCPRKAVPFTNYSNSSSTPLFGFNDGLMYCCVSSSSAWSGRSGALAINYAISPSVNATMFYSGSNTRVGFPAYNFVYNFIPPAGYTGSLPAGSYLINDGVSNPLLGENFIQNSRLFEEKITAKVGRGLARVAALQNNTLSWIVGANPSSGTFQLFGGGTLNGNPTIFNGAPVVVTMKAIGFTESFGDISRDLSLSYETPIGTNLHAGTSFVKSHTEYVCTLFQNTVTPPSTTGSIINIAAPSGISLTTNELRVFAGMNPSAKTSLDLSAYFVNVDYHLPDPNDPSSKNRSTPGANLVYTDVRYTYSAPRLAFVWRPTASTSIRAAVGGGFAEAPLSNLLGSNATCSPSATTCTISVENLKLQPERSFGFDVGTDIRLPHNTVLSFDVYRTNLFGQFYNSTTFNGVGTCPATGGGFNTTAPCYLSQFSNLGVSRYAGVLIDINHTASRGLNWTLSGGLTRGYVVSVPAGFYDNSSGPCNFTTGTTPDAKLCPNVNVIPGINFNGTFASSIPYAQGLGKLGYRWNANKYADLVATYFGNNNAYFRPAFFEFDGHIGYPLMKNASLLVTFRNITGIYANPVVTYSPATAAPSIGAAPLALGGQNYGPRTIILTTVLHM